MLINVSNLLKELQWAQRFAEAKTTIPILSNVLFKAERDCLTLVGTDLDTAGITHVDGEGRGSWAVAAPVKQLIKYLQKIDEDHVTLTASSANHLIVQHGDGSTRISGMSQETYPELPTPPAAMVTINNLPEAIERTSFAISAEENRFTLNGVLLELNNGESRMIGTDGHRLSIAPVKIEEETKLFRALIAKAALVELAKLEENIKLSADEDHLFFEISPLCRRIISRKLKGTFPDYNRVLSREFPNHVMLPVKPAIKVLERVAIYADTRSRAIRLTVNEDGTSKVYAKTVENGEAEGVIISQPGEVAGKLEAGYNVDYLLDFLKRTDNQVVAFCWKDAKSSAMLTTGDAWEYVVMPMRI